MTELKTWLTDKIEVHKLRAGDCPPNSLVVLASALARLLKASPAPSAAPNASAQAEPLRSINSDGMLVEPDVGTGTREPVDLDGRICEHCNEGNAVLTFEDGQFSSNCDMCCADCDYFMVERLNQLIGVQRQVPWDKFPGWLIDHHEGDTITEEGLQHALEAMLKVHPLLAAPAPTASPETMVYYGGGETPISMEDDAPNVSPAALTDARAALQYVVDCWEAAEVEGLADAISDAKNVRSAAAERLADLLERRISFGVDRARALLATSASSASPEPYSAYQRDWEKVVRWVKVQSETFPELASMSPEGAISWLVVELAARHEKFAEPSASPAALTEDEIYEAMVDHCDSNGYPVEPNVVSSLAQLVASMAADAASPADQVEPVAWMVTHPDLKAQPRNETIIQCKVSAENYADGGWIVRPMGFIDAAMSTSKEEA